MTIYLGSYNGNPLPMIVGSPVGYDFTAPSGSSYTNNSGYVQILSFTIEIGGGPVDVTINLNGTDYTIGFQNPAGPNYSLVGSIALYPIPVVVLRNGESVSVSISNSDYGSINGYTVYSTGYSDIGLGGIIHEVVTGLSPNTQYSYSGVVMASITVNGMPATATYHAYGVLIKLYDQDGNQVTTLAKYAPYDGTNDGNPAGDTGLSVTFVVPQNWKWEIVPDTSIDNCNIANIDIFRSSIWG